MCLPTSDACVPSSTEHCTLLPCKAVALKVTFNRDVKHPSSTIIPRAAILPSLQIIVCIGAIKSLLVSTISPPKQLPSAVPSQAVASPHTVHSYVTTSWGQTHSVMERKLFYCTTEDARPAQFHPVYIQYIDIIIIVNIR